MLTTHQHDSHVLHPAGGEVVVTHVEHVQAVLLLCNAHSNVSQANILPRRWGHVWRWEWRTTTQHEDMWLACVCFKTICVCVCVCAYLYVIVPDVQHPECVVGAEDPTQVLRILWQEAVVGEVKLLQVLIKLHCSHCSNRREGSPAPSKHPLIHIKYTKRQRAALQHYPCPPSPSSPPSHDLPFPPIYTMKSQ